MMPSDGKPVIVGISGASGSLMAKATVDELLLRDIPTILVCSNDARLVWHEEMGTALQRRTSPVAGAPHFRHYAISDMRAPIASGTFPTRGMVVVALQHEQHCIHRSRPSVQPAATFPLTCASRSEDNWWWCPRETPLHATHLENLLTLSRMGTVVLPPDPAFYLRPQSIDDVVKFVVGRILVALGVDETLDQGLQYRPDEA